MGGDWMELVHAAAAGDLDLVRYHVSQDIDVNYVHPEYMSTVLVTAIVAGHDEVALFLLDHRADPTQFSEFEGMTPLEAAQSVGMTPVLTRLDELGIR